MSAAQLAMLRNGILDCKFGTDPWFDKYESGTGDDIIASINAG